MEKYGKVTRRGDVEPNARLSGSPKRRSIEPRAPWPGKRCTQGTPEEREADKANGQRVLGANAAA
jgi:hypothetical protein